MAKRSMIGMVLLPWLMMVGSISVAWTAEPPSAPETTTTPGAEPDQPHLSKEIQAELRKQCEPDAKRLCRFVIPGSGRIYRCLETHTPELSAGCRKALAELVPKP